MMDHLQQIPSTMRLNLCWENRIKSRFQSPSNGALYSGHGSLLRQLCCGCLFCSLKFSVSLRSPSSLLPHQLAARAHRLLVELPACRPRRKQVARSEGASEGKLLRKPSKPSCCLIRPHTLINAWIQFVGTVHACLRVFTRFSLSADYLGEAHPADTVLDEWMKLGVHLQL